MTGYEEKLRERFLENTAKHELRVLHDDGIYRHLRCQQPGTWSYGFHVVTWPGYLAIVGDMGDYCFARLRDMFEFFGGYEDGQINPSYWAQKLHAPRSDNAYCYDPDKFEAEVIRWAKEQMAEMDVDGAMEFSYQVHHQILESGDHKLGRNEAMLLLHNFKHERASILEPHEWNLDVFDTQYLWCCHAIVWAINRYRGQEGGLPWPTEDQVLKALTEARSRSDGWRTMAELAGTLQYPEYSHVLPALDKLERIGAAEVEDVANGPRIWRAR